LGLPLSKHGLYPGCAWDALFGTQSRRTRDHFRLGQKPPSAGPCGERLLFSQAYVFWFVSSRICEQAIDGLHLSVFIIQFSVFIGVQHFPKSILGMRVFLWVLRAL
jgi:hypothetical protein